MFDFLKKIIGTGVNLQPLVDSINALEMDLEKLSLEELRAKTVELKERLVAGEALDDILPEAFALVREASKRTLGKRHFDVQLMGGVVLHRGGIAEMLTGEGKTLAATLPVYLNALAGRGAHVVTVNEYLAKRDAVWMGQVYHALGLSISCLAHEGAFMYDPEWKISKNAEALIDKERDLTGSFLVQEEFLRPTSRRDAYGADITYGTNHEFGFDYLRDNLAYNFETQVQRGYHFAIVDEADSILIDEARTPLIIASPDAQSSEFYKVFSRVVQKLNPEEDYLVDEKMKSVSITEGGIDKVENLTHIKNIYSPENFRLVHYLEESLRAKTLFLKDRDYVSKDGEIIIVDQFTGRLMPGRRYSGGLHQAIEAKEGVKIQQESQTYARISIQNYFRLYEKLAGMTGTAQTSAEEFHKVYNLEVVSIPPNRPLQRKDSPDLIFRSLAEKYNAVIEEVKAKYEAGQPVLLGTPSIEKNEIISTLLGRAGIPHEILNAKNNEREGAIIAQAGKLKAVMVATNMAGRGVDIVLGGNPLNQEEAEKIRELGGLHIIGTERHEARRIDNQLRGRAGRQGDPGSSVFFLSLEDDLLRIFGGDRIQGMMKALKLPENTPIESKFVSRAVSQAQAKVEGMNFDSRKHLLEYDDVLNKQRLGFYKKRQTFLTTIDKSVLEALLGETIMPEAQKIIGQFAVAENVSEWTFESLENILLDTKVITDSAIMKETFARVAKLSVGEARDELALFLEDTLRVRIKEAIDDSSITLRVLGVLDMLWMSHLENMDGLAESVRLRAYAQHDPLVEYRREGHRLYQELFDNFSSWLFMNLFRNMTTDKNQNNVTAEKITPFSSGRPVGELSAQKSSGGTGSSADKTGRNDPCPCGSGKKYKKCGLINAPEHKK